VEREQDSSGVSRGQNHLYVLPENWQSVQGKELPAFNAVLTKNGLKPIPAPAPLPPPAC